jgi:putative ABC transport system permease protein
VRAFLKRERVRREIDGELHYHIEMRTRDLVAGGMAPADARAEALRRFGDLEKTRIVCHEILMVEPTEKGDGLMKELVQDIRYTVRSLVKAPGFALVVVLTLGLGIGANTAIFSVVDGVLLRPLPYSDPDRLVRLWENDRLRGTQQEGFSLPDYFDVLERNRVFQDMATWLRPEATLTGPDNEPQRVAMARASHTLFPMLGVAPAMGRVYSAEEDGTGGERVVVLSHRFWVSRFGGDENVVGKTVVLDDVSSQVIGVMPAGFGFPDPAIDLWTPLQMGSTSIPRGNHSFRVLARLPHDVTIDQANADVTAIAAALEQEYADDNLGRGMWAESLMEATVGDVRTPLLVLLGAVGLVLLVACVNVTNLLFARASVREREVAIRTALGAGRRRLMRQFLTESAVLAFTGGTVGVLVAYWSIRLLLVMGSQDLPRLHNVGIDLRVLAFTLLCALGTGVLFGLLPAVQVSRPDLQTAFREGGRGSSEGLGKQRLRRLLVIAEVGLSVVLVTGAGLLVKSFWRLQQVDPGFTAANVLSVDVQLPAARYPQTFGDFPNWTEVLRFHQELEERLSSLSGVEAVALGLNTPVDAGWTTRFTIEGRPVVAAGEQEEARIRPVTHDYFRTLGIPIVRGRGFTEQDRGDAPLVFVINEAFARRYFRDEDPIGQRMTVWGNTADIVGIAKDVKFSGLDRPAAPGWYMQLRRMPFGAFSVMVRTAGDPLAVLPAVREQVRMLDGDLALFNIRALADALWDSVARRRFNTLLMSVFGAVAMVLAAVGIYGVISYAVNQRTHEIGVRMSLGASGGAVLTQVVRQGLALTGVGVMIGLGGSLLFGRGLASLLFGVSPTDLPTLGAVVLVLTGVAIAASYIPARRASRIDPVVALRSE